MCHLSLLSTTTKFSFYKQFLVYVHSDLPILQYWFSRCCPWTQLNVVAKSFVVEVLGCVPWLAAMFHFVIILSSTYVYSGVLKWHVSENAVSDLIMCTFQLLLNLPGIWHKECMPLYNSLFLQTYHVILINIMFFMYFQHAELCWSVFFL